MDKRSASGTWGFWTQGPDAASSYVFRVTQGPDRLNSVSEEDQDKLRLRCRVPFKPMTSKDLCELPELSINPIEKIRNRTILNLTDFIGYKSLVKISTYICEKTVKNLTWGI